MGKTYKIIVCGKKASGKTALLEQLIHNTPSYLASNAGAALSSSVFVSGAAAATSATGTRPTAIALGSTSSSNGSSGSSMTGVSGGGGESSGSGAGRYFATLEDIYVACWEKDKGAKEKFRFYDTRGLENARDADCVAQMRHLFQSCDGAVLVCSTNDADSVQCCERLKVEIEKCKDKKEICYFIIIDNQTPVPLNANVAEQQHQQQLQHQQHHQTTSSSGREAIRQELQTRLRANVYELTSLEKRDALCKPFIDLFTSITQVNTKGSMNLVQSIKKPKVFSSNK